MNANSRSTLRVPALLGVLGVLIAITAAGCGLLGVFDSTPPPVPSELTANSGEGQIQLSWEQSQADDLRGYHVYRARSSFNKASGKDPINSEPLTRSSYTDSTVQNGTTYYYRVTAIDEHDNESSPSNKVTVTPFAEPVGRP